MDPVGNNTWYYVHTLAVFYIDQVLVRGPDKNLCDDPPGNPPMPVTSGGGFIGCLKGWFVNYVTAARSTPKARSALEASPFSSSAHLTQAHEEGRRAGRRGVSV